MIVIDSTYLTPHRSPPLYPLSPLPLRADGQSLMNTTVVNAALAGTSANSVDQLRLALLATVYVMLIALPGYLCAIALVDRMGRYWLTHFGFLMSGICFCILAANYFQGNNGAGRFINCQPPQSDSATPGRCRPTAFRRASTRQITPTACW